MGFIKMSKYTRSMEDEVRFNIKTGRQITVNASTSTVDKEILDTVFSVLNALKANVSGKTVSLLDAAVFNINNAHHGELDWDPVDNDKFKKFILAPKKGE